MNDKSVAATIEALDQKLETIRQAHSESREECNAEAGCLEVPESIDWAGRITFRPAPAGDLVILNIPRQDEHGNKTSLGFLLTEAQAASLCNELSRTLSLVSDNIRRRAYESRRATEAAAGPGRYVLTLGDSDRNGDIGAILRRALDATQWPALPDVCMLSASHDEELDGFYSHGKYFLFPRMTTRETPPRQAERCGLPGCETTTTHKGGYCCAEHCNEHRQRIRAAIARAKVKPYQRTFIEQDPPLVTYKGRGQDAGRIQAPTPELPQ